MRHAPIHIFDGVRTSFLSIVSAYSYRSPVASYYRDGFIVVDDQPEIRYLNRHVVEEVCGSGPQAWLRLGNELLDQKHVAALNVIKSDVTESTMWCSEVFKLWIQRQPRASCREALNNSNEGNSHEESGICQEIVGK